MARSDEGVESPHPASPVAILAETTLSTGEWRTIIRSLRNTELVLTGSGALPERDAVRSVRRKLEGALPWPAEK